MILLVYFNVWTGSSAIDNCGAISANYHVTCPNLNRSSSLAHDKTAAPSDRMTMILVSFKLIMGRSNWVNKWYSERACQIIILDPSTGFVRAIDNQNLLTRIPFINTAFVLWELNVEHAILITKSDLGFIFFFYRYYVEFVATIKVCYELECTSPSSSVTSVRWQSYGACVAVD